MFYVINYYMLEDTFYKILGEKISHQRQRLNYTQDELAKRVNLNRSSISNIEQGRQKILAYSLIEFATELRVKPSELLPNDEDIAKLVEDCKSAGFEIPNYLPDEEKIYIGSFLISE